MWKQTGNSAQLCSQIIYYNYTCDAEAGGEESVVLQSILRKYQNTHTQHMHTPSSITLTCYICTCTVQRYFSRRYTYTSSLASSPGPFPASQCNIEKLGMGLETRQPVPYLHVCRWVHVAGEIKIYDSSEHRWGLNIHSCLFDSSRTVLEHHRPFHSYLCWLQPNYTRVPQILHLIYNQ